MSEKIIVIQSSEQFNEIFNDFKKSAKIDIENNGYVNVYLIGLDVECIAKNNNNCESFENCNNWVKKVDDIAVCKLQIATSSICLVIDLCKFNSNLPNNLITIIKSEYWIKTGVGISNDLKNIAYNFDLGQCAGGIDVKVIAELYGCMNPNLLDIYKNISNGKSNSYFEHIKNKKNYNTDWSRDLTIDQIEYAAIDAIMSYKIGEYLINGLIKNPYLDKFKSSYNAYENDVNNNIINNLNINKSNNIIISNLVARNYIGTLQEFSQKNKMMLPIYDNEPCDDNKYRFKMSCTFNNVQAHGYGLNKKEAKSACAQQIVNILKI